MAAGSRPDRRPVSRPGGASRTDGRGPAAPSHATRRTTRVDAAATSGSGATRARASFTGRALVLLLVVAVLGVSYASSIRAWINQRNEQHALSSQIASERTQIQQLRTAKSRWNDPAYVEQQARLRFGWVMPGERSYRVIGKNGKVLTSGQSELTTPGQSVPASRPAWWQGAVDSVETAGSPPPVSKERTAPRHHPATFIGPDKRSAGH